jgi:hypothetical protein
MNREVIGSQFKDLAHRSFEPTNLQPLKPPSYYGNEVHLIDGRVLQVGSDHGNNLSCTVYKLFGLQGRMKLDRSYYLKLDGMNEQVNNNTVSA